MKKCENEFISKGLTQKDISSIQNGSVDKVNYHIELSDEINKYIELYKFFKYKGKKAKEIKEKLLKVLENKVEANIKSNGNHHIRELQENQVSKKNIISVFDSSFTRTIGANPNELSEDFMVIQVFYFSIIKDLIYHGFMYKGEKYIYFTSSAGQIRTKKTVFVKESVWKKYEKTIMCGLTVDLINEMGGNNPN